MTHRQGQLCREGPAKLTPYLVAPDVILGILGDPALCPLGDLATVSRGVMTGANAFFFLSVAEARERGIDGQFLRQAQKSIRGVDRPVLGAADADHRLVDVHEYVTAMDASTADPVTADRVRQRLREDGFDALATYIAEAEAAGHHTGRTCARRAVWFDLGALPAPEIFLPKLLRERMFPIRNRAQAVPSNAIDCLTARDGVDPDLLHGVLLSSIVQALMEVWGRDEAGMLQLMTYETETLPVPDVRRMAESDCHAIRQAALEVCADPASDAAQRQL
ncbi:MAG: hypothetical protein R3324_19000, partial [Halobacteriales archaeon]|nr:hypothetical protein [Halobacteriales archaeon]